MSLKFKVSTVSTLKFVLILIMLFSIVSTTVSATITINQIVGSKGISYRLPTDTIGINVTSTSEVFFKNAPCVKVSSTNDRYVCHTTDTTQRSYETYTVVNAQEESAQGIIPVDNSIGGIGFTTEFVEGKIVITYSATDTGFQGNSQCSGLKSINISEGNSIINTVNINSATGVCDYYGVTNLTVSSSGKKSISLTVLDNVGNVKTSEVQEITFDIDPPQIISNSLKIYYSGTTQEVGTISSSSSFFVDVYFQIREDSVKSINLDLSAIHNNPAIKYTYADFDVPFSNCELNTSTNPNSIKVYSCVVRAVQMKLDSTNLKINVTVVDTSDSSTTTPLSKTFTLDNVIPQATLKTDKCDTSGRCYIKNGENNIIVTLTKNNFQKKLVFISIPGSYVGTNIVQNCTGSTCIAKVSLACSSGSEVEAFIASFGGVPSQDDSGNILPSYSTNFYCDNDAPSIEELNITGNDDKILDIVSGDDIVIDTIIREAETSELNVTVWLDEIKNKTEKSSCKKISDTHFNCKLNVANINAGYYDAEIVVRATDIAGNTEQRTESVKVFGKKSDNETPNNLGISLVKVSPQKLNRVVIDMATYNKIPFYVYATYDLNVITGDDVEVIYQAVDLNKCLYVSEEGTTSASRVFRTAKITNPYADLEDISRIEFSFPENTDPNLLSDEFEIVCNISADVKEGNYIYTKPQLLELRIPFKLTNTKLCDQGTVCTPGERIGKKIEEAEDNFFVRAKILDVADNLIPKLQQICNIRGTMNKAQTSNAILAMAANSVSIATKDKTFGDLPVQLGVKLAGLDACFAGPKYVPPKGNGNFNIGAEDDIATSLTKFNNAGGSFVDKSKIAQACSGFVNTACSYLTCSQTEQSQELLHEGMKDNNLADTAFGRKTEDALLKNLEKVDYKNSMLMSVAHQCWPAVVYNANKWRQTECSYVYCLKMAAYSGTDVSACEKAKFTQSCSFIFGEAMELPFVREYKNLAENAADYVNNIAPLAAATALRATICPKYVFDDNNLESVLNGKAIEPPKDLATQTFQIYGCQLPLQLARLADTNMRSNTRGSNFQYPVLPDMCELAKCVGEPNCQYEPDMWTTLSKIRFLNANQTGERNRIDTNNKNEIGKGNSNIKLMRELSRDENTIFMLKQKCAKQGISLDKCIPPDLQKARNEKVRQVKDLGLIDSDSYDQISQTDLSLLEFNKNTIGLTQESITNINIELEKTRKLLEEAKSVAPVPTVNPELQSVVEQINVKIVEYNSFAVGGIEDYAARDKIEKELIDLNLKAEVLKNSQTQYYSTNPDVKIYADKIKRLEADKKSATDGIAELEKKNLELTENTNTEKTNIKKLAELQKTHADCIRKLSNAGSTTNVNYQTLDNCLVNAKKLEETQFNEDLQNSLKMVGSEEFKNKNIIEQKAYLDVQVQGYNKLNELNKEIEQYNGLLQDSKTNPTNPLYIDLENKIAQRNSLIRQFGLCPNPDNCEEYFEELRMQGDFNSNYADSIKKLTNDINNNQKELNSKVTEYAKEIKKFNQAEKMGNTLYMALQYANAQGMLRFMYGSEWTERLFGESIPDYLDPDKWKENWCNPNEAINFGKSSSNNMVITCSGGICRPVLTYTAERTLLEYPNGTKYYVYTAIYFISAGDLRQRETNYNIYFYGGQNTIKGFRDDKELKAFDIIQNKTVFISPIKYDRMCIQFDRAFPPDNAQKNSFEFCRDIAENGFNTGSPWSPEEEAANAQAYTNQYDSTGNRMRVEDTNTNYNTAPPGVFDGAVN